jgi:hypothetical protein
MIYYHFAELIHRQAEKSRERACRGEPSDRRYGEMVEDFLEGVFR